MTLTIVVLDQKENFLQFLDTDLCHVEETIEYAGLRTLHLEYKFEDLLTDKELFRIGNKVWVQGDVNIKDCLYVINTEVSVDIYDENQFSMDLEEVLVELNYAPLFSQTYLTANNGFRINNTNDAVEVYVDWNALNFWFGDYFNIGVVQECLSSNASKVTLSGTFTLMNLLRQIEEETGNVFVTRYEKDCLNNTIHRYLDFLNPINCSKNWNLTLLYKFQSNATYVPCADSNGNEVLEDADEDVTPFDDGVEAESITEDTDPYDESQENDVERAYDWIPEDETEEDYYSNGKSNIPLINIEPDACQIQICNKDSQVLNTDGEVYSEGDTALSWDCSSVGLTGSDDCYTITLQKTHNNLGVTVNATSNIVTGVDNDVSTPIPYATTLQTNGYWTVANDDQRATTLIPDDIYLEIYDYSLEKTLFRTKIDTQIGTVHEDILDFGFNLENIQYDIDETNTYTAISPVIKASESEGNGKGLNRSDISTIINRWKNLTIKKGWTIPMIVEKVNVTASSLENAKRSLGSYTNDSGASQSSSRTNWWIRPLKPQDNTDSDSKTYEFYRAKAYWTAPFTKYHGQLHISTGNTPQYHSIHKRPDNRNERGAETVPKMGVTETTDEDIYAIYNQVCLYLKEHETPEIEIEVDVANLIGHEYNNYDLHDKVYLKMPNTGELLTARVTKTSKEAHDIAQNTIELSNYTALNTAKTIQQETYIEAKNVNFKYPKSANLQVRLVNADFILGNEYSVQYPANKLISFALYKIENGSSTYTGKTYTKITDQNGYAKISMKYDPGAYEIQISYSGDEEYTDTSVTINVTVGGTKEVKTTKTDTKKDSKKGKTSKSKTVKKTKYKKVKTYYDKYGRSPNKKTIMAIGKPSAGRDTGSYRFYEQIFKNKCPHCGKATLAWGIFYAGNEYSNWGKFPATGRYEGGSAEGHIFCTNCDADYSCQGNEHVGNGKKLTPVSKRKKSTKSRAYKLRKGKMYYGTKKVKIKQKNNTNKTRKVRASGINSKVKKQALSIVDNKTGAAAAKAIVSWIDKHISYAKYYNFQRSPATVLRKGSGNCCDVTRLCLQMLDVAGCTEFYKMYYVHVSGHVYARLTTKKSGKTRPVDCASDWHSAWGYICLDYRGRSERLVRYPKLPFY